MWYKSKRALFSFESSPDQVTKKYAKDSLILDCFGIFRHFIGQWKCGFSSRICWWSVSSGIRNSVKAQCLKISKNVSFEFWHFPPIFVLLKLTCLVTLFDPKLQICKNSPKWTILDICYLLLSIQNVWDFLKIFTYNALHMIFFTNFLPIQWAGKLILFDLWFSHFAFFSDHCNSLFWAKSTKPKVPRVCHHRAVAKNKDVVPAKKSPIQPLPVEIMSWNQVLKTLLWIQIQPKIYPHKSFWKTKGKKKFETFQTISASKG